VVSDKRVATVRPVSEESATGKVAEIYADIKRTKRIASVPNFWRVLATNPDQLELLWTQLKAIMHPEQMGRQSKLDPLTREMIALAVSATNRCAY
jgi:alkylhydroperoxidase family enzyme